MNKHILVIGLVAVALGASAAEPEPTGAAGVVHKVESAVVRGAKAAASGVERGAHAAARGVKIGVEAAARGVEKGAQATARAAGGVADKVQGSAAPSKPASSTNNSNSNSNSNSNNTSNWPPDRAGHAGS